MLHRRFLLRELWQGRKQALIFVFCVALSLATTVALNGFRRDVDRSITGDAQALHGGDIIVHSHYQLSDGLQRAMTKTGKDRRAERIVNTYEFYSLLRSTLSEDTLFANIKVVEEGYPLYGRVDLQSGRTLADVLSAGKVVVAGEVLDRLRLKIGDSIHVGSAVLRIADVVRHESARPVDLFSLGPRVFVAAADLSALDLIKKGSRVSYETLLTVRDPEKVDQIAKELKAAAVDGQERVETFRTAGSRIKRFFDNLIFFLSLISLFTLLLAGIGMQSSLTALLREKEMTLAIVKAQGATRGFLYRHYLTMAIVLGLIGSLFGSLAGMLLERFLPLLFAGLLPPGSGSGPAAVDLLEGLALGLVVVMFFTFLPLARLSRVKPGAIFRRGEENGGGGVYWLTRLIGLVLLTLFVVLQLKDLAVGLWFVGGSLVLILLISVVTRFALGLCRRWSPSVLGLRLAVKSLIRPGNATRSIVITLASSLSVLLAIFLLEHNLRRTFIESYPVDAPNLFCLDIQKDQRELFKALVGGDPQLFPVIRARLSTINGKAISRESDEARRGDSLTREFNLTYRDELLPDEELLQGKSLFQKDQQGRIGLQVSILDTVAEMGDMKMGDVLRFNIQGVPLEAEVTSIRTRTKSKLYPFFYFVFPPEFLAQAPQTYFAALHRQKGEIPLLENRIVSTFANISVINMAETAAELGALMRRLSEIITFFAAFSLFAGALILVSSILATRMARVREAVYYKILGGRSAFVLTVFFYENLLIGLGSAIFAVVLAQLMNWAVCRFVLEIAVRPNWPASLALLAATVLLVIVLGTGSSIFILRQKPADFLREQGGE
jgi:putative ABC transport system permease protein